MDVVALTIGRNEVAEGDETCHDGYQGQEHQGESHGEGSLMGSVLGMKFLILRAPEDAVVEAEHVEGGHSCDSGHNPTHSGHVGKGSGEDFIL